MHTHPKRLIVAAAIPLAVLFGLAPAAVAAPQYYQQPPDPYEYEYEEGARPYGYSQRALPVVAHELADAAAYVHRLAEAEAHHFTFRERVALRSLHRLSDGARHFHRQSERFIGRPGHAYRDFRNLVAYYQNARVNLSRLHAYGQISREFARVDVLMQEAASNFGVDLYSVYRRWD